MERMGSDAFSVIYVFVALVFGHALIASSQGESLIPKKVKIWPMPASVTYGDGKLYMSNDFVLSVEGSAYADASGILKDAFNRMLDMIKLDHVTDANFSAPGQLRGLHILVSSPNDQLQYGIDESYKLMVPSPERPAYAHLEAQTVYGALHGLETFSQLCVLNITSRVIGVHLSPWTIIDQPRFSFRGLLIDTSRHYLPLPVIKNVIDSMTYAKLNVLHWHIVDSQSFPLEIPSFPKLWDGAYSTSERYTAADAAEVVRYAQKRGINVMAEIDVPGHALSWGVGYPSLWPSKDCQQPLDVTKEFTFEVIDGILSDFSKIFKFKFVHLGGDEVDTSFGKTYSLPKKVFEAVEKPIYRITLFPQVVGPQLLIFKNVSVTNDPKKGSFFAVDMAKNVMNKFEALIWLEEKGMNESQAYEYFVLKVQKLASSHGYEFVNWEETFNNFGNKLSRKTVVHNWLGGGVAQKVVASGLRCIVSNQDKWYLDHLDATWQQFYTNEPLENITNIEQQKLVIGGEVCAWGEMIDISDIQQTIWPRTAAAAERLWTASDRLATNPSQVTGRLAHFRCLLNQRGVGAAILNGLGRDAPQGPGSCYEQ